LVLENSSGVVNLETVLKVQTYSTFHISRGSSFLFLLVLKQTEHHFISFAFFSDGDILSVKCFAVSLSGAGIFNSLPGQGGFKDFILASNNYFIS
jgi:hypothetical protein